MASVTGRKVGNFRLVRALGTGGMGVVYLAHHERIERRVAVKVLHPHLAASSEMVERFFNEALATNRIKHEGIVEIFDCGVDEEVGAYLVMEHLEGESLDEIIDSTELIAATTRSILRQVAEALIAVHERGIVHRDLKPGNIFVLRRSDDQGGEEKVRTKVLDFGTAKLVEGSSARVFTQAGEMIGTPRYMSPEQYRDSRAVDHRTDIYSLALIAYRLLCGRGPFDTLAGPELVRAHLFDTPDRPSRVNPSLPPQVDTVLLRALAKSPDDRFATMQAFAAALEQVVAPLADQCAPVHSPQAVRRSHFTAAAETPVIAAAIPAGATDTLQVATDEFSTGVVEPLGTADIVEERADAHTIGLRETRPMGEAERLVAARAGGRLAPEARGGAELPPTEPALRLAVDKPPARREVVLPDDRRESKRRWPLVPLLILVVAVMVSAAVFYRLARPPAVPSLSGGGISLFTGHDAGGGPIAGPLGDLSAGAAADLPSDAGDGGAQDAEGASPTPRSRRLWLTTRPPGARVSFDGEILGNTPLEGIPIAWSARSVLIEKRGYMARKLPLHRSGSDLRYANVALLRPPKRPALPSTAELQVVTLADEQIVAAEVFLDGHRAGESPLYLPQVPVGSRRVTARRAGFRAVSKLVRVIARRANKVVFRLEREEH